MALFLQASPSFPTLSIYQLITQKIQLLDDYDDYRFFGCNVKKITGLNDQGLNCIAKTSQRQSLKYALEEEERRKK